ncbi:dihydrolipoyllysine-residue acetyltransferase [Marinobacter gelidimuriae]|uniref:dihydrolipoyllysine-residue acetyltransferase n=1 Tax=Marinobacter gelidimuriae TaxID=2739064 RepID=UPI0003637DC5|nr:dihydrolipoyllysine-residue acetyltransferase [Marinobacter gelidimuriae]
MSEQEIRVPDLGGADEVEVIEILVSAGDSVAEEDPILTVETDKASVELPSPSAGKIVKIIVKVGDKIKEGDVVGMLSSDGASSDGASDDASDDASDNNSAPEPEPKAKDDAPAKSDDSARKPAAASDNKAKPADTGSVTYEAPAAGSKVHAGPAVRKLARELGADLARVKGSGPKSRIIKDDVHGYVKDQLQQAQQGAVVPGTGSSGIPGVKLPDFSQFGEVEREGMSRMMSVTALNMHRSWLNVPHVTQFEDADISDMEDFRKSLKPLGEKKGVKMTPLPFMLKACAAALAELPQFNVALDMDRKEVVHKKYIHIGIAVDTPYGLMVPVIRNVDQKGLWELAAESAELAQKARDKKLKPAEMQGACFTITSLGGIGGTAFTPIVNTPEVAILGVSKAAMKPVWDGKAFQPRLMLPLSLSYDHRAVNGADAARFTSALARLMGDIRTLLL